MRRNFEGEWQCEEPLLTTGLEMQVTRRIREDTQAKLLRQLPKCDLQKSFPALTSLFRQAQARSDTLVLEFPVRRRRRQRQQA